MEKTTVIIGAGISGLLVARELVARGCKVMVFINWSVHDPLLIVSEIV